MKYMVTFAVFLLLTLLFVQSVYDRTSRQFALLRDSVLTLRQVIADKDSLMRDKDSTLKERDSVLSQMQTPYPYNMGVGRQRVILMDSFVVDSNSSYEVIPDQKLQWERHGGKWLDAPAKKKKKRSDKLHCDGRIIYIGNEPFAKYYYNLKDATDTLIFYDSTLDTPRHGIDRNLLISEFSYNSPPIDLYDPATGLWHRYDPLKHDTLPTNHVYEYVDTVYIYVQGNNDTFVMRRDNDPWPWDDLHMLHPKAVWDSLMKANKRDTGQFKYIPYYAPKK